MGWKDIINGIAGKAKQLDGDDAERIKVLDRCASAWIEPKRSRRLKKVTEARKEAQRLAYPG